ncbi:MAG: carboxypeptidase-like regulatory domain-containing protein [Bacteroidota bacterium]
MLKIKILLLLLFVSSMLCAKAIYQIEGFVKDSLTKQAIPFANISIAKNIQKGTICNGDGYFVFKFQENELNDNILISCMGYIVKNIPVNKLLNNKNTIYLSANVKLLNIFEIKNYTSPERLLDEVIKQIPVNYKTTETPLINSFNRCYIYINDTLSRFSEVSYESYDNRKYYDYIKILKNRYLIRKDSIYNKTLYANNLIFTFHDIINTPFKWVCFNKKNWEKYNIQMSYNNINSDYYYEIKFESKKKYLDTLHEKIVLTINPIDFSMSKITWTYFNKHSMSNSEYYYKKFNNIWVPSFFASNLHFTFRDKYKVLMKYENLVTEISYDENKITEFTNNAIINIPNASINLMPSDNIDDTFWNNNNFLPIENKLKQEIEILKKL